MKVEKLRYVAPAVDVRRVVLEAGIVATASAGRLSLARVEEWADGDEDTLGDEKGERGDLYFIW
jgi:hypothetical protein